MRITFRRIEIHNFMSYADETFDFDKNVGLNLICGKNNDIPGSKNGVGKSQLNEALCYALYGQTRNNIKNANIRNKYVKEKDVRVVLNFSIDDNSYKVISGFNKYGSPYCQLFSIVDGNDDQELTKSTIAETRKYLETEILHCDIEIFLRTVILSSDQTYNFFKLSKGDKKAFIERLFDISVFGDMYNLIHRDILDADKVLMSSQNRLMLLNRQHDEYSEHIKAYEKQQKELLDKLNAQLSELKEKQNALQNLEIKSNAEEAEKYQNAIDKLQTAQDQLSEKLRDNTKKLHDIELKLGKLQVSKDQKQKLIDKHSELLGKLCNDCKTIFSDYYNIDIYKKAIADADIQINKLQAEKAENVDAKKAIADKSSLIDQKIQKALKKIQQLTEEYNKNSRHLAQIEQQLVSMQQQIDKEQDKTNPYASLLEDADSQIAEEEKALDVLKEKYTYLKYAENIVSQDTLRKFIIADLIGLLNNKIKTYLTKFGVKFNVVFDSDMNYTFSTAAGEYEYDSFSAGERARIMIATCFAFRDFMYIRNNLSSNILILDEFIDGAIDSLAIDSVLEILKNFSQMWNQNIYIISHRKEIDNSIFNNIIQIVKTDNIAKITYINV